MKSPQLAAFCLIVLSWLYLLSVRFSKTLRDRLLRFRFANDEPTSHEVVNWALEFATSVAQIQKSYDWRITQWSALANAILTAMLSLLAASFFAYYKNETPSYDYYYWAWLSGGIGIYLFLYGFCRWKIHRLRLEFTALHTLLAALQV